MSDGMSSVLWTWLIGLSVAVMVLALSLMWWLRRSTAPTKTPQGPLPLFSGAQGALWHAKGQHTEETFPYVYTPPKADSHLPGTLEIEHGPDAGLRLGFHHVPNTADDVVTFGRSQGPPGRHVQLRDGTVSRRHAMLRFAAGRWHLTNLARENPVRVNGHPLGVDEMVELKEGDLIAMGETRYRYRAERLPSVDVAKDDVHLVR